MLEIPKNKLRLRPRNSEEMNLMWQSEPDLEVVVIDEYNKKVFATLNSIYHALGEDSNGSYTDQILWLFNTLNMVVIEDHQERKRNVSTNIGNKESDLADEYPPLYEDEDYLEDMYK